MADAPLVHRDRPRDSGPRTGGETARETEMGMRETVLNQLVSALCGEGAGAWRVRDTGKRGTVTIESPSALVRWRVQPRCVRKERAWRDASGRKAWRVVKRLSLSEAVAVIERAAAEGKGADGSSVGPMPGAKPEGVLAAHRRQREAARQEHRHPVCPECRRGCVIGSTTDGFGAVCENCDRWWACGEDVPQDATPIPGSALYRERQGK